MNEGHLPVLVNEVLEMLAPAPGSLHLDATLGGGGHTERILEAANPDGRLLGLDADPAGDRPRGGPARVRASGIASSSARRISASLGRSLRRPGSAQVDGCLFDLGLSSYQLADRDRGFGFRAGGPLDMRFDPSRGVPAAELLATLDANELIALFRALRRGAEGAADRPGDRRRPADRTGRHGRGTGSPDRARRPAESASSPPDASGDPRLPGVADRRQRGARGARRRARRRAGPAPSGRTAGGPQLPLARGPDRQAVLPGGAPRLRLPARPCRSASVAGARACDS